jgi:hypothetical protein
LAEQRTRKDERIERLLREKDRLTERLMKKVFAAHERGAHVKRPKATWLRTRIHRIDTLLEREGYFDG